jgi:hypothetical protein
MELGRISNETYDVQENSGETLDMKKRKLLDQLKEDE